MFQIWNILLMFAAAENDLKNYGPSYKENGQLGTSIRKGKIYYEANSSLVTIKQEKNWKKKKIVTRKNTGAL